MSQLAALVEAQQEALVQQWTQRLKDGLAPGDATEIELRDHIPSFLREVAMVLRRGAAPEASTTAQEHGRQRYRLGFSLQALSREYTLMRHLIMDLAATQSAAVTLAELRLLIDFIGTAIADAIAEHARQREFAERTAAAEHQQTVLERATWLSTTLETIGDAVITTGPSSRITFLNPVAERLTGWSDEAARDRPLGEVFRIFDARTGAQLLSPVERVLTLGTVHGLDHGTSLARADGSTLAIEESASPIRSNDRQLIGVVLVFRDVTAKSEIEASRRRLAESEERLRLIVAASGIGTWAMDLANQTIVADQRFHQLLHLPDGNITFETLLQSIHPDERGQVTKMFSSALQGGADTSFASEYRIAAPAGGDGPAWVETRGSVTRSDPLTAPRLLGTVADTTERKRTETALRRQSEFEQQLIGIVSHDLRNPLNAIKMGSSLLARREEFDERSKKTVLGIQSSTNRAIRLVNDLLDFTQARLGGGLRIERRPVDLHELLRASVQEIEAAHPGRTVHLKLEGDGLGAWDGDRLTQVIQNLVTNALKYSPHETPVEIAAKNDGPGVLLSVHNQGTPIAPDRVSSIFQPLQRGTDEIDKTARSVGLGLYIVQAIVDAHEGLVIVTSSAAAGTTFAVHLPRQAPTGRPTEPISVTE